MKIYLKIAIVVALIIPGTSFGARSNMVVIHPSSQVTEAEQVASRFIQAYHQLLVHADPAPEGDRFPQWQKPDKTAALSLVDWDMLIRFRKNITHDKFFKGMYADYPGVVKQNPLQVAAPEISTAGTFYLKEIRKSVCGREFNKIDTIHTTTKSLSWVSDELAKQMKKLPAQCLEEDGSQLALVVYVAELDRELDYFTVMLNPATNKVVDMDGFR